MLRVLSAVEDDAHVVYALIPMQTLDIGELVAVKVAMAHYVERKVYEWIDDKGLCRPLH